MKKFITGAVLALAILPFSSCDKAEEELVFGALELELDHKVGASNLQLEAWESTNYPYTNALGQAYNITRFGYYVTGIQLSGPDGAFFEDHINSSANASEVKGFYHVEHSEPASRGIHLHDVPAGKYNQLTLTIGIPEQYVQEGATGGVLDPANGAWFWNWDAGYIGLLVEGQTPASPREAGPFNPANFFELHVGGWKSLESNPNMVNNVKVITLDFPTVTISEGSEISLHLEVDVAQLLDGPSSGIDFTTQNSIHSPIKGQPFAGNIEAAFVVDHVHQ